MIEAFEIGISLALQDGITGSIMNAQRNVTSLQNAVKSVGISIQSLREAGVKAGSLDAADASRRQRSVRELEDMGLAASADFAEEADRTEAGLRTKADTAKEEYSPAALPLSANVKDVQLRGARLDGAADSPRGDSLEVTYYPTPRSSGPAEPADRSSGFPAILNGPAMFTNIDSLEQSRPAAFLGKPSFYGDSAAFTPTEGGSHSVRTDNSILIGSFALPREHALQPVAPDDEAFAIEPSLVYPDRRAGGGNTRLAEPLSGATVAPPFGVRSVPGSDLDEQSEEEEKRLRFPNWPQSINASRAATGAFSPDAGGQALSGAARIQQSEAGRIAGDVYFDGVLVGRWISRCLQKELERADAGPTGFDPKRGRFLPGVTVGG